MVARKGQPNLANNPVYQPDWKERVAQRDHRESTNRWSLRSTQAFTDLVRKAARRRGMNNSAYVRRAVAAFIANDLQIPFEDICQMFPAPGPERYTGYGVNWPRDDGEGYGEWEVKS